MWITRFFKKAIGLAKPEIKKPDIFGVTSRNAIFRIIRENPETYEVAKGHFKRGVWVDVKIFPMWKDSIEIISEQTARSLMRQRQIPNYKHPKKG